MRRQDPPPPAGALAIWLITAVAITTVGAVGTGWTAMVALVCGVSLGIYAAYHMARIVRARIRR